MNIKILKKIPSTLNAWILAIRLRSIPIPTIQVLTGASLAYASTGVLDWLMLFYTWAIGVFVTIGTNLINDVFDFDKGRDSLKRTAHIKVIQVGLLSRMQVYKGGMLMFGLAVLCSFPLIIKAGWIMLPVVVLSTICGYCYTGGPYPICYLGLSEIFIFVFYGGVCVISSFFIQAGFVHPVAVLAAIQMGMLAILPNALNNFRDMFEDAKAEKLTLAVRFGKLFARREIAFFTFLPFAFNVCWFLFGYPDAALFPFLLIPLAFLLVRSIWITEPGPIFNRYFGLSVIIHFLFGLLLIIGWFLK